MPYFGIVLPTYNRKRLLRRAVQSVLDQTCQDFLVCIIDDGSSDGTDIEIQDFISDERIHYIRMPSNSGVNAARNRGLDYLVNKTKYITFLDDDDFFVQTTLSTAKSVIEKENCKWLIFSCITPSGEKITTAHNTGHMNYLYDYLSTRKITGDSTLFISSDLLHDLRFPEEIHAREYLLWLQLSFKTDFYFHDFASKVCEYLPDGLTHASPPESPEEKARVKQVEDSIFARIGITREEFELIKAQGAFERAISERHFKRAFKHFRHILKWHLRKALRST